MENAPEPRRVGLGAPGGEAPGAGNRFRRVWGLVPTRSLTRLTDRTGASDTGAPTAWQGDPVLTSLFGDLGSDKNAARNPRDGAPGDPAFQATAIMETVATEVNAQGQMVDRHSHDLVVTGSAAQAIREHLAGTRSDLDTATSLITLLDPAGVWASAVIKALSDAGGQPIERLHLREQHTLRTLATIERTTLVRRHEDTLRIYHAEVRAPGRDNAEVPVALMERSQLTTVIVGPLEPHPIDDLLAALHHAAGTPSWRCRNLLFVLPPNAVWIANKIGAVEWPPNLQVHVLSEPMTSASSVWNAMLGMWNHVKAQPGWSPDAGAAAAGGAARAGTAQAHRASPGGMLGAASHAVPMAAPHIPPGLNAVPAAMSISRSLLDPSLARSALAAMAALDGLLGGAVVDSTTGLVLASDSHGDPALDMNMAAAAAAQVLRAHRHAARSMGSPDQIDEVIASAGMRQQIMRTLSHHPELFLVALFDRHRTNLALARLQLADVERRLG